MGLYDHWPYTNFHELNLTWLLRRMEDLTNVVENFVALNTIKYADPIQWNITTQYEPNTVVVDPNTGTAYISSKPVPAGVGLTNTDYWSVIFTLDVISANKNITLRDDGSNVLATFSSVAGDWLLWNGTLYKVLQTINVNEAYVVGYNIQRYTVELFVKDYVAAINTKIGALDDLNTTDQSSIVNAINELVTDFTNLSNIVGALDDLNTTDKSSIVNAINEVLLAPVFTKNAQNTEGYVQQNLTVGDIDRNKYESLVTGSGILGSVDGQSPNGNIGVFGASSTSDIPDATDQYPLGVMGLAVADNAANNSTIGAGYYHMIRKANTSGASIGLEIDCDIEVTSQDYHPNSQPDPLQDYSSALQLSSGGGGHTGGNSVPLSTAISVNANPATFRHGLVITTGSVIEEAICLPSNTGGLIAWWNDPNGVISGAVPVARVEGVDLSGYGAIHINLWNNGTQAYEDFYVNRNTFKEKVKFKIINVASASYAQGLHTIDVSAGLDAGYKLIGVTNMQPDQSPSHITISSWTETGDITFYQHDSTALTCAFNVIVAEREI